MSRVLRQLPRALALLALAASPAAAGRWASVSLLAGTTAFDPHLADYQWRVTPRAAWGAQALAGTGPVAAGLRLWSEGATQELALGGVTDPAVHVTSVELVTRARVAAVWGTELLATASAGRQRMSWSPDEAEVSPGVAVRFAPVVEWTGGAGAALERALPGSWRAGVQVERRVFGLDTAHRAGATVVMERETFGAWSARLELARVFGRH